LNLHDHGYGDKVDDDGFGNISKRALSSAGKVDNIGDDKKTCCKSMEAAC
jgi:hypothetical protein